jgi:hypothetical protein
MMEPHEKARLILDRAMVEGISPAEQSWLDEHIDGCTDCSGYAKVSIRAVRALDSFAFEFDPAAALRVQNVIRSRAEQLASSEAHTRRLMVGTVVAMLLTVTGSLVMWQPTAWLAGRWNLPSPAWQIAFVMFWLLPSLLVAVLPCFRRRLMREGLDGEGEMV